MDVRPRTWSTVFAAGVLLRPALIVPMAQSGPLRDPDLLPVGLLAVFAVHILLAAAVYLRVRLIVALALVSAVAGIPLALIGVVADLPMPWPLLLAGYNVALVAIGIKAWQTMCSPAAA